MNLKFRNGIILIAALTGMLLTASLGRWQLSRAAEKENLQTAISNKALMPELGNAAFLSSDNSNALVHQRVSLSGWWLTQSTVYLDNRQLHGKVGFFVFTPLRIAGSTQVIWVQRGWVPRNFVSRSEVPVIETPDKKVHIEGRIAPPPSKLYAFAQAEVGVIRQNLDMYSLQLPQGLSIYPLLLQQQGEPSEGLLRNWPLLNLGVEKHYGYAFQWFGLCGLIAVLLIWFKFLSPLYNHYQKAQAHEQ